MCGFEKPGTRFDETRKAALYESIPVPFQYACRYWVSHPQESKLDPRECDEIRALFRHRLLFWIEWLAWMGELPYAITAVSLVHEIMEETDTTKQASERKPRSISSRRRGIVGRSEASPVDRLLAMVQDARRFIHTHGAIIELAPLQIYCSALLFSPMGSLTRQHYSHCIPKWILQAPYSFETWSPHLQTLRHTDQVTSVVFSGNGKLVATAAGDTKRLWDATTGGERGLFKGHSRRIIALRFVSNGAMLATASLDQTVRVWETTTGRELRVWELSTYDIESTAFSSDGKTVAIAHSKSHEKRRSKPYYEYASSAFVHTLNLESGRSRQILAKPRAIAQCVAFAPGNQYLGLFLAVGTPALFPSRDRFLLVDITNESRGIVRQGRVSSVRCKTLAFSPDGTKIAMAGACINTRLSDVTTGKKHLVFSGTSSPSRRVSAMGFSPDNQLIAMAYSNGYVSLFDASRGIWQRVLAGHSRSVKLSTSADNTVRLWDAALRADHTTFGEYEIEGYKVTFSPDSMMIATWKGHEVQLWDAKTGKVSLTLFNGWKYDVKDVVFSPDGTLVASASRGVGSAVDVIQIHTTTEGKRNSHPLCNGPMVGSDVLLNVSPDEGFIAASTTDYLAVWDINSGNILWQQMTGSHKAKAVAFSPEATLLATGSASGVVDVYQWTQSYKPQTFKGHRSRVEALCFSPDGTTLASASEVMELHVWDVERGIPLRVFKLSFFPQNLDFSPCGKHLKTERGDLGLTHRPQHLSVSGNWLTEDDDEILFIDVNRRQIGFCAYQNVVFPASGTRLTLSSGEKSMLNAMREPGDEVTSEGRYRPAYKGPPTRPSQVDFLLLLVFFAFLLDLETPMLCVCVIENAYFRPAKCSTIGLAYAAAALEGPARNTFADAESHRRL
ncbi:hypothetical protein NM208_g3243 [Fusarium decemcellulare]|uniref:Uncharacterized protein n=1 Tax=Fusarium decemcellulare TaxID=57161 RepID=A0ACC1SPR3_9HYPO|nr:hypothetical protein NM208_g3243 [Fusarium decemcellulare]